MEDAIIYFALGRFVYAIIGDLGSRWRMRLLLEFLGALGFIACAPLILRLPGGPWRAAAIASAYVGYGLSPLIVVNRLNGERAMPGIIDSAWTTILGFTLAVIVFLAEQPVFTGVLPLGRQAAFYQMQAEDARFFLGHLLNAWFALCAALGACMTILWAGAVWRETPEKGGTTAGDGSDNSYSKDLRAAVKMVLAFGVVSIAALGWLAEPLLARLFSIADRL